MIALFLVGIVFYGAWTVFVVATDRPIDYYVYAIAAYGLVHGKNIYAMTPNDYGLIAKKLGIPDVPEFGKTLVYKYPPLTAIIVSPLTLLPARVGATIWVFSGGLAALIAALLLGADADSAWKKRLILFGSIGFTPILSTMGLGQVNNFVLLLTAAALYVWRKDKQSIGGIFLGFGLWLKALAIGLVPLALLRERWRILAATLSVSLVIVLVGFTAFGSETTQMQLNPYFSILLGSSDVSKVSHWPGNQNIAGMFARYMTPNDYGPTLANAPYAALFAYWVSVLVFSLGSLLLMRPLGERMQRFNIEAALLIVTTLLISPFTEINHLAMSFVAFAVLINVWVDWKRPDLEMIAVIAAYFMINLNVFLWRQGLYGIIPLDLGTWAEITLWTVLAIRLRGRTVSQL